MRLRILILAFLFPAILYGQLTAPGSSARRFTSYPGIKDPVFIYCNSSGSVTGSLTAVSPGGTAPFTFTWKKWNTSTKTFSDLVKTESGVNSSSVTGLAEGGYRVTITDGGTFSTELTGWVSIDKPVSQASLQNRTCDYVALKGNAAVDIFNYYDPASGKSYELPNSYRFLWSSSPSSTIPFPDYEINPQTFDPPLVNVTYKLQVTDSFNCVSESSFYYESIHVKADFAPEPSKGEAPLEVEFTNKSIRGANFTWEFGDDSILVVADTLPVKHIYYKPGEYSVKLSLVSAKGCEDSLRFDKIVVDPSKLDIPNVFTPDGDGYNDYFKVDLTSMKTFSLEIFSRSGLKVYGFFGDSDLIKDWQGWDGNINNSSIKASPGIYFYLIRAYGWDDVKWEGKEYRGFLYLYR